jgi:hypothetical protein
VASASTALSSPKSLGAATRPVDDAAVEPLVEPLPDQAAIESAAATVERRRAWRRPTAWSLQSKRAMARAVLVAL